MMLRNVLESMCGFCAIAVLGAATASGQPEQGRSHMQPEDRKVLKHWLDAGKSKLRPAVIADCDDLGGLSKAHAEWGSDYHPYYRAGDFNKDGRDDFAVALVDPAKEKDRFSIAIFHGGKTANAAPAFFEPGWDLTKRGLHDAVGLIVMSLSDQDDCVILLWDGKRYITKKCVTPPSGG
jgi:hypothetical protein